MEVQVSPKRKPRQVCRFALDAPKDCSVAVCMLPGTELAFEQPVTYQTTSMFRVNTSHTVAISLTYRAFFALVFDGPLPVTAPPLCGTGPVRMWAPLPARRPVQP